MYRPIRFNMVFLSIACALLLAACATTGDRPRAETPGYWSSGKDIGANPPPRSDMSVGDDVFDPYVQAPEAGYGRGSFDAFFGYGYGYGYDPFYGPWGSGLFGRYGYYDPFFPGFYVPIVPVTQPPAPHPTPPPPSHRPPPVAPSPVVVRPPPRPAITPPVAREDPVARPPRDKGYRTKPD